MPFYPDENDLSQYNTLFDFLFSLKNSDGNSFFENSDELSEMLENSKQITIDLNDGRSLDIYDHDSNDNENFVFTTSNDNPDLEEGLEEDGRPVSALQLLYPDHRNNVDTIISVDYSGEYRIFYGLENQQTEEEQDIIDSSEDDTPSQTSTPKVTSRKLPGKRISIPPLTDDNEILRFYQKQYSDTVVREEDMERVKELYDLETKRLKTGIGSDPEISKKIRYRKDYFTRKLREKILGKKPRNKEKNTQHQLQGNEQFDEHGQNHQKLFAKYRQRYPYTSDSEIENLVILKISVGKDPGNDERIKRVHTLESKFLQRELRQRKKYTQPTQKSSTNESEPSDALLLKKYKNKLKGASSSDINKLRELHNLGREQKKIYIELAENISQLEEKFNLLRTKKYQITPESLAVDNQTTLSSEDAALKARSHIKNINNDAIPILRIIEELQSKINMLRQTKASVTRNYKDLSEKIESNRKRVSPSKTTTKDQAIASSSSAQSSSLTQASSSQPQQQEEPRTMQRIMTPDQQSQQQNSTLFPTGITQIEQTQRLLQQRQTELTQLQQQLQIERMQRQLLEQQMQKETLVKQLELERAEKQRLERQRLQTLSSSSQNFQLPGHNLTSGAASSAYQQDTHVRIRRMNDSQTDDYINRVNREEIQIEEPSSPPLPLLRIDHSQQWRIAEPPRAQDYIAPTTTGQSSSRQLQQNPPPTTHATSFQHSYPRTAGSKSGHDQGQT